ncbi:DUF2235 domain-containing protein [Geomonas sp.]|uniref:DUF2235 domain-containing protein n=1 Tax=Geomonas sp. TaxID=2651584 RepID=UPI002B48A156|nr:DUF2235 domain-containing protein [Geomonas sp.]HJV35190.1 DUF2235 domain-containing protein [Geomonas sp.]
MKRIIICCDGTWNSADDNGEGEACDTNVAKIAELIAPTDSQGNHQVTFYHQGVGSGNLEDKIAGGAFGVGLSKNIMEAYRFLASNHIPGDEIWLFGFSRGAYTARSIVGLIRNCGLLKKEHLDKIPMAYELYRNRSEQTTPASSHAENFKDSFSDQPGIHFLGVWDTVGSLGVPDSIISRLLDDKWNFHDVALSSIVKNAYHAVAIDERREDFKPCLWQSSPQTKSEQVWFPGVHSDIGGGYRETGLSDCALAWMICRAQGCGLQFNPQAVTVQPSSSGQLHDSKKGFFRLLGTEVRAVEPALLSLAALQRHAAGQYDPKNWPATATPQACPDRQACQGCFKCF